jgi:hypothetical protein
MLSPVRNWELKQGKYKKVKKLPNQKGKYVPHGIGRMCFVGIHGSFIQEGYFKNGLLNGYCRWIWQDGLMYIGHCKNSKFHGPGEMTMGQSHWDIR